RCRRGAGPVSPRAAGDREANLRAGRRVRMHGDGRVHSGGGAVRSAGDRSTGMEGGAGTRSSSAGDAHHAGDFGYAGSEHRRRDAFGKPAGRRGTMKIRIAALVFLGLLALGCVLAGWIAPEGYAEQFRSEPDAACSRAHLLGTDHLGRDRFARVLYGTRVSLLLAPAAALLATVLAGLIGGAAGFFGGQL